MHQVVFSSLSSQQLSYLLGNDAGGSGAPPRKNEGAQTGLVSSYSGLGWPIERTQFL